MKLLTKRPETVVLDEGATLGGYVVVDGDDAHARAETRYGVTGPGGEPAILIMSRRPFADRHERARFRRNAELRTRLVHPAAIEVRDFGEHGDNPYVVTEPHGERTLDDLLEGEAPLEPNRLIWMLGPVAAALDMAHEMKLVHQGLGSGSLLLDAGDELRLDAFALFEVGDEGAWSILQRADLRYRPPEQLLGAPLGPAGDIYSFAALIFHGLTGEPPYSGDRLTMRYAHLSEPPPQPTMHVPSLGHALDDVIARGMAKDPLQRPESAISLLAEVAGALGAATTVPAAPPRAARTWRHPSPARATGARRRRFSRPAAVAAVVAAALCGGALGAVLDPLGDDARSAPAGADAAAVWKRLDSQHSNLRAQLASAALPQEQADLAGRIAAAYDGAARALPPGTRAEQARDARDAYARLAAAAEAGDEAEFAAASDAVTRAERRLRTRR